MYPTLALWRLSRNTLTGACRPLGWLTPELSPTLHSQHHANCGQISEKHFISLQKHTSPLPRNIDPFLWPCRLVSSSFRSHILLMLPVLYADPQAEKFQVVELCCAKYNFLSFFFFFKSFCPYLNLYFSVPPDECRSASWGMTALSTTNILNGSAGLVHVLPSPLDTPGS